ncbi:hypothetical protein APHWI1_1067 [Anaplasma phagocytophilum str. ApWI1]|uniref:Uncharacterized protein n=1 Tax=Anaplasma phagocytophilum str. ApWI1 TaxID=1359155 RepID=A0A0F3Q072_ANAPH|nr:hypothetical protein APHHGE2_0291 [Anaplasma phagocytophilum str. HGE2]KJV85637.1 hypothetical protein APHWI1_1067 [Anaplasma phagocytophilum str. ApWI1]KJV88501.1 hypothetical protein APHNYW_0017 [Anaplasma phagocytophilum str. ApNYW]KJV99813.1 hypothetical protein OTSANNIE_0244 [Anaplasma phagocytophilum str. Annie]
MFRYVDGECGSCIGRRVGCHCFSLHVKLFYSNYLRCFSFTCLA